MPKKVTLKQSYRRVKKLVEQYEVQILAMKRVVWAIVHQEGGEYIITPANFDKCHEVFANWETTVGDDGSFTIVTTHSGQVNEEADIIEEDK